MSHTKHEIKKNILWFMETTGQREIRHIVNYCLGYYGFISKVTWECITEIVYKDGEQK